MRCPVCRESLTTLETGGASALRCRRGHSFDIAKQGYVTLLAGRAPHVGDTAQMVAAREEFLGGGHYDVISRAVTAAAVRHLPATANDPLIVDAGGGTGRHLAAVLDAVPDAVGLVVDVSKAALRRAARAHPRGDAALADTWRALPLAEGSAALLLNVFAPRNGPEFRRVLRPDGALVVVTPEPDHLVELVTALDLLDVDPEKADRIIAGLGSHFAPGPVKVHRVRLDLPRAAAQALVAMGPSARHTGPDQVVHRLAGLPEPVAVTLAVRVGVYRPR
ncbi:MAG TPA: 23S rRNA methyltransferase [Micromonosporaceae bacterium]|nr:23S rRNA methyltransferase [Micromonosporaceae bacterium]